MHRKILSLLLLTSCAAPTDKKGVQEIFSPAGTVVAADSFTHSDGLNNFLFKIVLEADSQKGVYTLLAQDGPRDAAAQFTMPKGGETLPLAIKKEVPTAFLVGFKVPEDTTFYPYYRVRLIGTTIEMQYTNAYQL